MTMKPIPDFETTQEQAFVCLYRCYINLNYTALYVGRKLGIPIYRHCEVEGRDKKFLEYLRPNDLQEGVFGHWELHCLGQVQGRPCSILRRQEPRVTVARVLSARKLGEPFGIVF